MLKRPVVLLAGVAAALVAMAACTEKGRSLILVDIDADGPLSSSLASVTVTVSQSGHDVGSKTFSWVPDGVNHLGVFAAKNVTGPVTVSATGLDSAGKPIAISTPTSSSSDMANVQPGGVSSKTSLHLSPAPGTDGGTDGAVGTGGSGAGDAGTGGGAGTGSGGAGTGGAAGFGAGGAATGGATGAGTGGVATGGTAGTGTGGTAGAGSPTWHGDKMVETDVLVADWTPSVAVDAAGNAVLAYRHGTSIRASRYGATAGTWSAPFAVDSRTGGQAYSPAVAVDRNGRWLMIWQQDQGLAFPGIWQSTSTDGTIWTAPTAITTVASYDPALAMNADGAAVAAWYQTSTGSGGFSVFASVRGTTGTWSAPLEMKPSNYANSFPPHKLAMSGTGEAFVVWEDLDDADLQDSVWMRRFSAGSWMPAALVETYDAGSADTSGVAANSSGQAIIAWRQGGATVDEMWARRYSPTDGLTAPALLAQGTFIAWEPAASVTLDDAGFATVAWAFEVQGKFNVYTTRAAHGQPWPLQPTAMETDNLAATVNNNLVDAAEPAPVVRSDAAGNVVLVWRKSIGARFDLWARRFSAGVWGPPGIIESQNVTGVAFPVLGMGTGGTAVAAWYYDIENRIWANVLR